MKKLTFSEIIVVSSMLFGLFFGAGNLIFPASMGQLAGQNIWAASVGFLITGVGLPLLGVAALGISHENGLLGLSSRVSKGYGLFFYLRPVFDDRTVLRHSPLCFCVIYGRCEASAAAGGSNCFDRFVFLFVLCGRFVFFASSAADPDLDR